MLNTAASRPVLVVGGGSGGLLLATRLAQRGHAVTVFERNAGFGGYNGRFGGDGAPLACYKALGLEPGGNLYRNLVEHGIWLGPAPRRMDVCDHVLCAGESLALPGHFGTLRSWLCDRYPRERAGIERMFDAMQRCHEAIGAASGVAPAGRRVQALAHLSELGRERYRDRLAAEIADPGLRRLLALRAFSASNTTSTMLAYLARILIDGVYHVPGSGAALTDMLVGYLARRPGVSLRAGTEVSEVLFDGREQAVGVRTSDGTSHYGHVVVGIDPLHLARNMVRSAPVGAAIERAGAGAAASLGALCFVFDVEPGLGAALAAHSGTARFVLCDAVDPFEVLDRRESGAIDLAACKVNLDSNPAGVVERVYVELDCRADACDGALEAGAGSPLVDSLVRQARERLEALHPDFADGIVATRVLTPGGLGRATGNRAGAASGFADAVDRPRQLDRALYGHGMNFVGQWSLYGSGLPQLDMSAGHAYRNLRAAAFSDTRAERPAAGVPLPA